MSAVPVHLAVQPTEPTCQRIIAPGSLADADPVTLARQTGTDGEELQAGIAAALGVRTATDLSRDTASADFVKRVPIGFARRNFVLGLADPGPSMPVAISHVDDLQLLQVLARFLDRPTVPVYCPGAAILAAINLAYQQHTSRAQNIIESLDTPEVLTDTAALHDGEDLLDLAKRAPVIRLVNTILFEAIKSLASDIHMQPTEDGLVVRMRIDGVLYDCHRLPEGIREEVTSRVKVMARMDIAEKRLAQDGRTTVKVGDRTIDLRISTVPSSYGERVVIRLLDKSVRLYTLGELGMSAETAGHFRALIGADHGIVLVTGPTGSGKTTTLYAALQELDHKQHNIITLEDPIEYGLPGISQIQVSDRKGMTFASGLRSVLRQDPDIIMVGEIRDRETAAMAIQSALTGHLVFSTLHTNDAAGAIARLLDLGVEPYLLASSVIGVLAQRLVRRNCPACVERQIPAAEELARLAGEAIPDLPGHLQRGKGCPQCRHTGYSGRIGIFELMIIHRAVRQLITQNATASQIKASAVEARMVTLRGDGLAKAAAGLTTLDEVFRVTARVET